MILVSSVLQMSASLRERLRKSGRCYSSPLSCKQPCLSPSTPRQPTWPGKWENGFRTPSNPELLGASAESSSVIEESSVSTEHISCSDITRPRPNRKPEMNTDTGQARLEITSDLKEDHSTTSTSTEPGSTIPRKLIDGSTFSSNMETCSEGVLTLDSMLSTDTLDELKTKRQKLLQRVQGKKECLRKLNMVKMYRAKVRCKFGNISLLCTIRMYFFHKMQHFLFYIILRIY